MTANDDVARWAAVITTRQDAWNLSWGPQLSTRRHCGAYVGGGEAPGEPHSPTLVSKGPSRRPKLDARSSLKADLASNRSRVRVPAHR